MIDLVSGDPFFAALPSRSARGAKPAASLSPNEERLRKAQAEKGALRKAYNAQKKAEIKRQLTRFDANGADAGKKLLVLVRFARRLGPNEGRRLIEAVKNAPWLLTAHVDLRHLALDLLGRAIVARRVAFGLVPFDDPLPAMMAAPGRPSDNAFSALKRLLRIN